MDIDMRRMKTRPILRPGRWSQYVVLFSLFVAMSLFIESLLYALCELSPADALVWCLSDNASYATGGQQAAIMGTMGMALIGYEVSTLTKFPNPSLGGPDPISLSQHIYDVHKAGREGGRREAIKQNVRSTYSTVFGATGLDQKMGPMVDAVLNFGE